MDNNKLTNGSELINCAQVKEWGGELNYSYLQEHTR